MMVLRTFLTAAFLCISANASLPPPATTAAQRAEIDALRAAYAVRPDSYTLTPETVRRLADIWKMEENDKRMAALHEWERELMKREAEPGECAAVLTCAHRWGHGHFCNVERDLYYHRLTAFWNSPDADPTTGPGKWLTSIFFPRPPVGTWLNWAKNAKIADIRDTAVFFDAINGRTEGMPYSNPIPGEERAIEACRIWNAPEAYASLILAKGSSWGKLRLRRALRDTNSLLDAHSERGIRRWRYTWGKDLPQAVRRGMEAMRTRRDGNLPGPEIMAEMDSLAAKMEPDMLGFIPRCQLAVEPTSQPWQPLDAPTASLFSMPDSSVPFLPQWNKSLLGQDSSYSEDRAAFARLAEEAAQNETLPALLAFSLGEATAALPDGYSRAWMNVDGYDTFRYRLEVICKKHGIDIIIDESGPRFSRDDAMLKAAARKLALALHRCILQLAILEHQGDGEKLKSAAGELADVLNKMHLWPLIINEYELRGIPPETYVALIRAYADTPELLRAFAETAGMGITFSIAREQGGGTVSPTLLASLIRDAFVLRGSLIVPEKERNAIALWWMREDFARPEQRLGSAQYACSYGCAAILPPNEEIPDALISGNFCYTGFCLVRQALNAGDPARAEAIFSRMARQPGAFQHAETHLAHALLARYANDEKTAQREEKNALILAAIAVRRGGYGSYFAFKALLDAGLLEQAERMQLLFQYRREYRNRKMDLAWAFAGKRQYNAAAFQLEELLHEACVNATPSSYLGTQADIVSMRAIADGYRALALLRQGKTAEGGSLLEAALRTAEQLPTATVRLAPAVLACADLPEDRRRTIRNQWLEALRSLPRSKPVQAALEAVEGTRLEPLHSAEEAGEMVVETLDPYPGFTSPVYTWHFPDRDGHTETAEAAIERAWYEDFSHKNYHIVSSKGIEETAWHRQLLNTSWIRLRHPEGRLQIVSLTDIEPDDIDHLIDWKKHNGIRTWTRKYPKYGTEPPAFDGMIVEAGQANTGAKLFINGADVSDGKYVVFRLASGGILRLYVNQLIDEDKPLIEEYAKRTLAAPRLRTFSSWKDAMIDAEIRETTPEALMLGRKGGPEEAEFQRTILGNPGKIIEMNASKSLVVCMQDENGNWDAAGREVMAEVGPWIESIFPPGSDPEDNIYRTGFLVRKDGDEFRISNAFYPEPRPEVTALMQAIRQHNAGKVRTMLAADPSLARARGFAEVRSALAEAVVHSSPPVVAALLDAGANPRSLDHEGNSMIALACRHRKPGIASLLLARGADAQAECGVNQSGLGDIKCTRPIAYVQTHVPLAEILLKAGASASAPCCDGKTPLVIAAGIEPRGKQPRLLDSLPVIDCYIKHGADINARDEHGNTPLSEAIRTKNNALLTELIRRGADPNGTSPNGKPLLLAAQTVDTARALLDGGADVNATAPCSFETALSNCLPAPQNHVELIRLLLERGARYDITPNAAPCLHRLGVQSWAAVDYRDPAKQKKTREAVLEVARLLIEHGADVNEKDAEEKTLLDLLSARTGRHGDTVAHPDFLDLLRRHGARTAAELASPGNAPAANTPLAPQE